MLAENPSTTDGIEIKIPARLARKKETRRDYQIRINRERRAGTIEKRRLILVRKNGRMVRFRSAMRYEIGNLVTHSVGLGLAICGTVFLIRKSLALPDQLRLVSFSIYGGSIIFLYLASTVYHALWAERAKKFYRRLDHSAIYLAISGTFTPIALVVVGGTFGRVLLITMWAMAMVGVLVKFLFPHRFAVASVSAYLLMGWSGFIGIGPVYAALPSPALWLLLAGGLFYTGGTIVFSMDRLPYNHMMWHGFVLAGSVCHFISLYTYV